MKPGTLIEDCCGWIQKTISDPIKSITKYHSQLELESAGSACIRSARNSLCKTELSAPLTDLRHQKKTNETNRKCMRPYIISYHITLAQLHIYTYHLLMFTSSHRDVSGMAETCFTQVTGATQKMIVVRSQKLIRQRSPPQNKTSKIKEHTE